MNPKLFIILLFVLGILFAVVAIYFSLQPSTGYTYMGGTPPRINQNLGMGAIALGIISAGCFIAAAILLGKINKK